MEAFKVPEELRLHLQKPLGKLLKGELEQIYQEISKEIERLKPARVIAVGDIVIKDSLKFNIKLDLAIADFKTRRVELKRSIPTVFSKFIKVVNPPGHITLEAIEAIKQYVLEGGGVFMAVEGEEDLLVIPAVLYSPIGSIVIYGQPGEGVVLVIVNDSTKIYLEKLMETFNRLTLRF